MPRHAAPAPGRSSSSRTRNLRFLPALVACVVACVVVGCGGSSARAGGAPGATPTRTATPQPAQTLLPTPVVSVAQVSGPPVAGNAVAWRHANLPAGYGMAFHQSDLHVAASDGRVAYSCGEPAAGGGQVGVVVTRDRGATWTPTAALPGSWNDCQSVAVDELNPSIVVVCCGGSTGFGQVVSMDGGATWTPADGPQAPIIFFLATRGARTYAIGRSLDTSGRIVLAASDDHLQTWQAIDAALPTSNLRALWVNPANGALLVEGWPDGGVYELWSSGDGGAHWAQLTVPIYDVSDIAVQQPSGDAPWHICATPGTPGPSVVRSIACTTDGGLHWTLEPVLDPAGGVVWERVIGQPADGAVVVEAMPASHGGGVLYRLPAGATRWQTLGAVPAGSNGGVAYLPAGTGGALWTFPAESDGAGAPDDARAVFTAAYPY